MLSLAAGSKVGLVLTGGGAKGAYQVGALRYLAEQGFEPHIIAGTSIGALNGAIIASYPQQLARGVSKLEEIWREIGAANIISANPNWPSILISYGLQSALPEFGGWLNAFLQMTGILPKCHSFFDPRPIEELVRSYVNYNQLKRGTELWVTVFPSLKIPGLGYDLLMALIDGFRARTGTKADWLRAQDINDPETLLNLLLASAAIPLAFPQRQVNGQTYVDGALQDNVPLGALAQRGCTHAIVIHLEDGVPWNRYDFPDLTIIEIRPQTLLNTSNTVVLGSLESLLDFRGDRIAALQAQGYADAKAAIEPIFTLAQNLRTLRQTHEELKASTAALLNHNELEASTAALLNHNELRDSTAALLNHKLL